jgi:predicted phage-related endonuclease
MNKFTYIKQSDISKRSHYVGSSELPTLAMMNLSYGQTPLTMYMEKKGLKESFSGNERTEMGHELEALILKLALKKLDEKLYTDEWYISKIKNENKKFVYCNNTHFESNEYEFSVSHPDLIVKHDIRPYLIEAKSTGYFAGKRKEKKSFRGFMRDGYDLEDFSENGIPDKVYLQVQDQLLLSGVDYGYVAVLIDNTHKLYGPILPNAKIHEICISLKCNFWHCMETDTPPEPETWEDIKWINPDIDKESSAMIGNEKYDEFILMKSEHDKITEKIKILEERKENIKVAVGLLMGENKTLVNMEGIKLATQYDVERESISLSELATIDNNLYCEIKKLGIIKKSEYRQLRLSK